MIGEENIMSIARRVNYGSLHDIRVVVSNLAVFVCLAFLWKVRLWFVGCVRSQRKRRLCLN